jgi:hypothetical protein
VNRAPDYIEPVVGWRVWYAVDDGWGGLSLSSVVHRTLWPQGEALTATCRRFRIPFWPFSHEKHEAPSETCSCGIYAVKVPSLRVYLPEHLAWSQLIPVIGRVSLWGSVHEYTSGWRASYAYPERLFVPIVELGTRRAAQIIDALRGYRVPIRAVESATAGAVLEEVRTLAAAA